jgi:exopolyphosphatase/guanosine-5'-triphosphate,3'-diphosphate pyrophosphatase
MDKFKWAINPETLIIEVKQGVNIGSIRQYSGQKVNLVLNPDRADVLLPACDIFLKVADKLNNSRIYIPKIGLSDGIIKQLYSEYKKMQNFN